MRRREFLIGFAGCSFTALASPARAAEPRRYRIGILETIPAEQNEPNLDALRAGLKEHGYIEGQNLELIYRSANGAAERFPKFAADLVGSGVDAILTRGTPATKAAKAATSTIPVVMAAVGEPLGVGVVNSLAHPGGNVTGLTSFVAELAGKRLELLKEAFPSVTRVGFMQNMGNPVSPPQWQLSASVAKALGMTAVLFDIRSAHDIRPAFDALAQQNLQALSVGIDAVTQANVEPIVKLAAQHQILTAYPAREFVDAGGLLSYGPSYPDLYFRAAGLIDKIFRGAKPGDLPVEQPTKLELVVNLKTAKTLGRDFPPDLLARADEVIE
ncbi:MAG TPA: ABC transporter substrate-binding protein [Pseudolabrys sp.]|nr:ABC transporter substrate-binding protein [Pseudolabrys sp.]